MKLGGSFLSAACSSSASSTATYVLPVLSRRHATVDQPVLPLSAYKEAHGDCLVPTENAPEHSQLATWVYQQQKEYRKLKEGNSSKLTADHVVKLNDIGFVFERREKFLTWEGEFIYFVVYWILHVVLLCAFEMDDHK